MNAEVMFNFILTADELQVKSNFRSVLILCGIAGLILLVVAIKLFYDRVIGPKIDELEEMDSEDRRNKKKNKKSNKANSENDSDEDVAEMFQYASITDSDDNSTAKADNKYKADNTNQADNTEQTDNTDSELNDEEIMEVAVPVHGEDKD